MRRGAHVEAAKLVEDGWWEVSGWWRAPEGDLRCHIMIAGGDH